MEGILNGQMALAQAYLSSRFGNDAADLAVVIATGLEEVLHLLQDRDLKQASLLLANMVCV